MPRTTYLGRKAVDIENEHLRVTLTEEGGHIAEIFHKESGVNPLWTPHWATGEPSAFGPAQEILFGNGAEAKLLYGILGHNLCLDLFGGPSQAEKAAGMTAHGEASILKYTIEKQTCSLVGHVHMPLAQLEFKRTLMPLREDVLISETVRNLTAFDRPLAWTQHVTLSPPFLDPATTEFRATGTRGMVIEADLGEAPYLLAGAEFRWPHAPLAKGSGTANLQRMSTDVPASSYTAIAMQPGEASWTAWSPQYKLALSYIWQASDFPWLGIWEENRSRRFKPWNGCGVTRGMEFGTSPFPETRRQMVERGRLLDTPAYRWLSGHGEIKVKYSVRLAMCESIPQTVTSLA